MLGDELKKFMLLWDENVKNERKQRLKSLLDSELSFYFKKDGDYYGCPEDSRLIFAKIKNPDEDVDSSWSEEACFLAINLNKSLNQDEASKRLFYKKDMDGLKIVDRNDIDKHIMDQ